MKKKDNKNTSCSNCTKIKKKYEKPKISSEEQFKTYALACRSVRGVCGVTEPVS